MSKQPRVSQGWSAAFDNLAALADKAGAAGNAELTRRADVGYSWTLFTNVLGGNLPAALRGARAQARAMLGAVR